MDLDLFDRVEKGDLDYIKTVKRDVLLKARVKSGESVLSIATQNDQLNCCKEILDICPSLLYHHSDQRNTVLHDATYYKSGIYRLVDFFVSFALDEATTSEGENMVRFKRWIKLRNHNEDTALTQAAYYQNLHIVKRLVEVDRQHKLGLSEMRGYNSKTALQLAVGYKDQEMIEILTDNGEGDAHSNYIPLSISVDLFDHIQNGDLDYIQTVELGVLLNSRDEARNSALLIATKYDQLDCCEEILKRCPSLLYHQANCKDTVLHYATYYKSGIPRLIEFFVRVGLDAATNEGNVDNKERENMVRFKKWMRLQNNYSNTALTQAAYYQNFHIVKLLVEVDRQHKLGLSEMHGYKSKTALQLAVEYQDQEMIEILTDNGEGDTHSNYIPLSISLDLFDHVQNGDLDYIQTVELEVLLNSRDEARNSALLIATKYDQLDCCEEILKRCPSLLYHQAKCKDTVLHYSTYYQSGIPRLIELFVRVGLDAATNEGNLGNKERESMVRFKNWMRLQNNYSDTVLTQAAYYQNLHIVKMLVEVDNQYKLGLSEIVGYKSKTALQLALEYQNREMIKLLTDSADPDMDYGAKTDGNIQISMAIQQAQESLPTGNTRDTRVQIPTTMASKCETKMFTLAEVSKHNNLDDCWLVINSKVYDVTKLIGNHPGGDKVLLEATGKDATDDFEKVRHSSLATDWMEDLYVGEFNKNSSTDSITRLLSDLASEKPQPYSHAQLKNFTKEFSHSVGSGGFGDVFKGEFPNGVPIAVKVLKNDRPELMEKQFVAEVSTMGRTYHRNLIKLYGYCYEADMKALIYEYMEKGALDEILKENNLDMVKLYTIATEIARGISYLHESCKPQIIHHDLKPANVLLDSEFSPRVIDFGLAKLNIEKSQFLQTGLRGTRGYVAPEMTHLELGMISYKCDVFSFGMILFDILKSQINYIGHRWLPGQVWEKFKQNKLDEFINDYGIKEDDKENAKTLAMVALLCSESNPQKRPSMSTVVKILEGEMTPRLPVNPFPLYDSSSDNSSIDSRN